ncbi:RNA ligase [Candidatus Micrarchaeota archaeon]|nr:RNA ligase [Candidatus Micrarchaeota archaeon]
MARSPEKVKIKDQRILDSIDHFLNNNFSIKEMKLDEALKRGKAQKMEQDEIEYIKFKDSLGKIERGTVITEGRVIPGYPHIKRIFTLEKGIAKNIKGKTLYLEEKIDGFNVRIAFVKDKICGFSRGGFLDLFVTEKAQELKLEKFFADHPEWILCGEMIGNTPHTQPTKEFDVKLLIFDVIDENGEHIPVDKKYRLLDSYKIRGTPRIGQFSKEDIKGIQSAVAKLNISGAEGAVIRSDLGEIIKYVTAESDIKDILECAPKLFDMPIGFFYQRALRSAMFTEDFKLDQKQYAQKLGNAILGGIINGLRDCENGHGIFEDFEILISDLRIWSDIKKTKSKDLTIEEIWIKAQKDKFRIRFRKHYHKTTRTFNSYLNGKAIED